jgi:hypothetical protein
MEDDSSKEMIEEMEHANHKANYKNLQHYSLYKKAPS